MKLKKFLAGIGALLLCSLLFLSIEGQAAEQSENVMPITTKVPDAHTVLLDVGKHGFVLINGKTYTHENKEAEIGRLARQEYIIQADKGWQTESVRYGKAGAQETVKLTDNAFTVPAINSDDNQLRLPAVEAVRAIQRQVKAGLSVLAHKQEIQQISLEWVRSCFCP